MLLAVFELYCTIRQTFAHDMVDVRSEYCQSSAALLSEFAYDSVLVRYRCSIDAVRYGTGMVQCVNILLLPTV